MIMPWPGGIPSEKFPFFLTADVAATLKTKPSTLGLGVLTASHRSRVLLVTVVCHLLRKKAIDPQMTPSGHTTCGPVLSLEIG